MKERKIFIGLATTIYLSLLVVSLNFQTTPQNPWVLLRQGTYNLKPDLHIKIYMCGILSLTKGIKEFQDWQEKTYTTDHYGFRNLGMIQRPRVVVLGDSFVVGVGLNDDETLTYKMGRLLNEPVYNYAGERFLSPAEFLAEPRFQSDPPKVVIWAPVEYQVNDFPLQATWRNRTLLYRWAEIGTYVGDFKYKLERDNFLTIFCKKMMANILYRFGFSFLRVTEIIEYKGKPKLTLSLPSQNLCLTPEERKFDQVVKNLVEFNELLKKRGIHFIFAPLPSPGSIYPESYKNPCPQALAREGFVDLLLKEMQKRNIDYVDLKPLYLENKDPYLYISDDTHWNANAVGITAQSLVNHLLPVLPEKSGPEKK